MGMVKDISVPFVSGTCARTLRDQRKSGLHIFLLDATMATARAAIVSTSGLLLLLLLLLLMVGVVVVQMMGTSRIGGSIRNRISR